MTQQKQGLLFACVLLPAVLLAAAALLAEDPQKTNTQIPLTPPTVAPAGLQIIPRIDKPKSQDDDVEFQQFTPFNTQSGTRLALLVKTNAARRIIGIDENASTFTSFTDDRGTDLIQTPEGVTRFQKAFTTRPVWVDQIKILRSGALALVEVWGASVPAKGAKSLTFKATLNVILASCSAETVLKNVDLTRKPNLPVSGEQILVSDLQPGTGDFGFAEPAEGTIVSFVLQGDTIDNFVSASFEDEQGNPINAVPTTDGSGGSYAQADGTNLRHATRRYVVQKKDLKSATLRLRLWKDRETIDVPVDITLGIVG